MGNEVSRLIASEFQGRATLELVVGRGDPIDSLRKCDVVIDFSSPQAALELVRDWQSINVLNLPALVVGSTGWKIDERRELEDLAQKTAVLMSSNFSTGVLAVLEILRNASPVLEKLGYTPVLVETHHRHKKDAPSGTAIAMQRAVAPAGPGNVQTHSVRAGEVIGDHELTLYGPGDHITIGHFAQDRSIFARGAIEAAIWLAEKNKTPAVGMGLIGIETFFKERYL
jgi:4-hydroxy-tetrahydrodipicolinate reductase